MPKENDKKNKNKNFSLLKKYNMKWVLLITLWTFLLAISVSLISESILRNFDILLAFVSLIFIIIFGVFFDVIGIAVTASDERTFHSMAANKVKEAKYAVKLVRNAGPVSNFCNDVIGDISGIISGAAGTIIVMKLVNEYGFKEGTLLSIVMSGIIAALTVGGKAIGKEIAIKKSEKIIFCTSKVLMLIHMKIGIDILPELRKKKNI
ncbi:hypothetical protein [Brassicibacter mesophilus]|uniref:hypothetical protein n=1 Tax=Brassicibacter mesophilus TaxID=745119 RepID=UPI003D210F56